LSEGSEKVERELRDLMRIRMREWRRGSAVERVEHPTKLDRARALG
jgi:ribosomal protein L15E